MATAASVNVAVNRALYLSRRRRHRIGRRHGARRRRAPVHIAGKVEASDMESTCAWSGSLMLGHIPAPAASAPAIVAHRRRRRGCHGRRLSIHPRSSASSSARSSRSCREARAVLRRGNHHVFDDPRVQLVFDDARHFLQTTDEKFDVINVGSGSIRGSAARRRSTRSNTFRCEGTPHAWRRSHAVESALRDRHAIGEERDRHVPKVFPDTTLWNPDLLEEGYDLVAFGRPSRRRSARRRSRHGSDAAPRVKNRSKRWC